MFWDSPEQAREQYARMLRYATVAVGNRDEVEVAVGTRDPREAATRLLAAGVRLALVKQGGEGVLVATEDGMTTVPPQRVTVVCGLGAGDAFGGALVHGLLAGWDPVRCAEYANAAGAFVAARLACADAMPTLDELEAALGTRTLGDDMTLPFGVDTTAETDDPRLRRRPHGDRATAPAADHRRPVA
jgi:5-dehydro-2-deoxygluconokinase